MGYVHIYKEVFAGSLHFTSVSSLYNKQSLSSLTLRPGRRNCGEDDRKISGAVVGRSAAAPEFRNSTKLNFFYMFQLLSSSSIQINKPNFQKLNIKA
jgi:hypothetical protein